VADLPAAGTAVSPATAPQVKDVVRIDTRSGHVKRVERWVVPQRMEVKVTSGHVLLDFTQAVITQPSLQIDANVGSGMLTLLTKPGIVVDADEVAVSSGGVKVRAPWGTDVPVILRIEVTGRVRSGHLRARPPRRTFWQWLLRRPHPYQPAAP
jgi:predicted molibdopterin-dependent oxidoreductase YjgC